MRGSGWRGRSGAQPPGEPPDEPPPLGAGAAVEPLGADAGAGAEPLAAENMDVEMRHFLPAMAADVGEQAVAGFDQPRRARDLTDVTGV